MCVCVGGGGGGGGGGVECDSTVTSADGGRVGLPCMTANPRKYRDQHFTSIVSPSLKFEEGDEAGG